MYHQTIQGRGEKEKKKRRRKKGGGGGGGIKKKAKCEHFREMFRDRTLTFFISFPCKIILCVVLSPVSFLLKTCIIWMQSSFLRGFCLFVC